ncbi:MAG: hypothetical protein U0610_28185 [bacterium]
MSTAPARALGALTLLAGLAGGCSGSEVLPSLGDFPPEPRVAACVTPVDPSLGALGGTFASAGTVIEQGGGDPPDDCFRGAGVVGRTLAPGAATEGAFWYRIARPDGGVLVVGLEVEQAKAPPLAVGDPANFTLTYTYDPLARASLTLRGRDDEVEAWVSASAESLALEPKIEVEAARIAGREPNGCGSTDLYDALVRFDTLRAVIPYHWVGTVGEMRVINAEFGVPNYPAPDCAAPPGAVETFLVAATRMPPKR